MAVTKIMPIRATVQKAVDYICNPDKTDDKLYVDSSNCSPNGADIEFGFYRWRYNNSNKEYNQGVKAYHQIQSFKPDEVTPELAHKIGMEFAKREFGEKYAYIVATHTDKGHIHNHIISCAYATDGGNKYHDGGKKDIYRRRNLSDEICKENGLSVIEHSNKNWQSYKEWEENKKGTSWKQELKNIIDKNIAASNNWSDFIFCMKEDNIIVNDTRRYITFKGEDKKAVRGNTLGENYSREKIKERIKTENEVKHKKETAEIQNSYRFDNRIIDTSEEKFQNNIGLNRWANKNNMETADQLFNEIRQEGFNSVEELRDYIIDKEIEIDDLKEVIDYYKTQANYSQRAINAINDYTDFKKYRNGLKQAKDKEAFKEKYNIQLNRFNNARNYLKESNLTDFNEMTITSLQQEMGMSYIAISEAEKKIKNIDDTLLNLRDKLKQLDTYLGNTSEKTRKPKKNFDIEL